jgi:hypothetical protein
VLLLDVAVDNVDAKEPLKMIYNFFSLDGAQSLPLGESQALQAAFLRPGMRIRGLLAFDVNGEPAGYTLVFQSQDPQDFRLKLDLQE